MEILSISDIHYILGNGYRTAKLSLSEKIRVISSIKKHMYSGSRFLRLLRNYCIQLIRYFSDFFTEWFHPEILNWEIASPALVYYADLYPDLNTVFFPNYYVFNKKTVQYLIDVRSHDIPLWIKYIPEKKLFACIPTYIKNIIIEKRFLNFSEFYYIYTKYTNRFTSLVNLIQYYTNQDFTELYQLLQVEKVINE